MNTIIWILQVLIAAFFFLPGFGKTFFSKDKLMAMHPLEPGQSIMQVRIIGSLELLGLIGIIVPLLTGIMPILTPIAATGLGLTMVGAFLFHLKRKEYKKLPVLAIVSLLSFIVAWYRFQII